MTNIVRSKFAWLAGSVFALMAGSVVYGATTQEPVPPAPPTPPARPVMGQNIVIVEKQGVASTAKHVRTITRDGKTFVFQTDEALSDAELEHRIAAAEANLPLVTAFPVSNGDKPRMVKRRVIMSDDKGEQLADLVTDDEDHCVGKEVVSDVDSSSETEGKLTRVRVKMCGTPGEISQQAMAKALAGIAEARAEIAKDKDLPESVRKEVLKDLDAELTRLKRAG